MQLQRSGVAHIESKFFRSFLTLTFSFCRVVASFIEVRVKSGVINQGSSIVTPAMQVRLLRLKNPHSENQHVLRNATTYQ